MQNYYQLPLSPRQFVSHNNCNLNQSPRHFAQVPISIVPQQAQVVDLKQYEQKWVKKIQQLEEELCYSQQKASYLEKEYEDLASEAQGYKEEIRKLKSTLYQCDKLDLMNQMSRTQENNTISTALDSERRLDDKEDNLKDQIIELQKVIIKLQRESSQNKIEAIKWKNKYIEINKLYNELSIEKQKP
ncbi:unnamed protein product [Paramecium octaurelia]|uniref:Uncharacterized protein n=1 Tax=Paramecium octaurelia TaxID=43137 RepID=A0A8S1VNQ4_PAROT|nr:unnamed protein product [Paramecium octaurelia]